MRKKQYKKYYLECIILSDVRIQFELLHKEVLTGRDYSWQNIFPLMPNNLSNVLGIFLSFSIVQLEVIVHT